MYNDVIAKVKSNFINFLKKKIVNLEFEFYKFWSKVTVIHSHPEIQLTQISGRKKVYSSLKSTNFTSTLFNMPNIFKM